MDMEQQAAAAQAEKPRPDDLPI